MKIQVSQGQNIIRILSDEFASCLVIEKAMVVNWPDCGGSVAEFYATSSFSSTERERFTNQINEMLISGNDHEVGKSIELFLHLFENGEYRVNLGQISLDNADFHISATEFSKDIPAEEQFTGHFYPFNDHNYFYTQTNDKISRERVEFYCKFIQDGGRPKIITFNTDYMLSGFGYSPCYILDGHHKLEAYRSLNMDVPCVFITRIEAEYSSTAELLHHAFPVMKEVEFTHLLENNDENMLKVDLPNDKLLTGALHRILQKSSRIDTGIINILIKYARSTDPKEMEWYLGCLEQLRRNKLFGEEKKLEVYHKVYNEQNEYYTWYLMTVANKSELESWIENTLK